MAAAPATDVVLDVKVVVVGDSSAGKSAILTRFFDDKFEESTSFTIGIDFRHVTYQLEDGTKVRLCVWDTAGQERFRQLAPSYIRDAHVILIVFDLTGIFPFPVT
ncbi:Miro-like protein [Ancylostoma duodenale]|uniref:Miro-like protein n=1 Tax=Ancylostoma duodenale TaxID=51022 RepID=A0A0C2C7F1_9BILA|nr:Miro-like protein [Ancylostoma duodenale]